MDLDQPDSPAEDQAKPGAGRKRSRPLPLEWRPIRQISGRGSDRQFPTSLEGALSRFLRAHVGQPWDQVFSEISARLPSRGAMQRNLMKYFSGLVVQHPIFVEGVPHIAYGHEALFPLGNGHFYIDPETGLLCLVEKPRQRKPPTEDESQKPKPPKKPGQKDRLPRGRKRKT